MIDDLIAFASRRLKNEAENDAPGQIMQYWIGYLDALRKVKREAEMTGKTCQDCTMFYCCECPTTPCVKFTNKGSL